MAYERSFEYNTPQECLNLRKDCATIMLQDVKVRKGIFDFNIEQVSPTKIQANIYVREGSEPIVMDWWLEVEIPEVDVQSSVIEVDWVKEGF